MEENLVGTQGGQELIERLEALNTILGGLRRVMVDGDGRVSSLEDQVALMSTENLEQRVSQINEMMASLRGVIESKLETVGSRLTTLEAQEPSSDSALPDGFDAEWSSVISGLEALKSSLSRRVTAEEIFPQLDEIRAHQEAMESRLHALGQMDTVEEITELKERHGDHQLRLQQLEASKEQAGFNVEQLKSQWPEMLATQSATQSESQKQEFEQRGIRLETQWQSLGQESRDRLKGLEDWKSEALEFGAKVEGDLKKSEAQALMLEKKLHGLQSQSESETSELSGALEESMSEFKMVLDGLSQRDVSARAKESELQKAIDALSEKVISGSEKLEMQLNETKCKSEASLEMLSFELKEKSEALGQLKLGQDKLVEELTFETEKRAEGMTRELVLARDHMEDQQKRVDEDLDDLKKSQRELGHMKEQLTSEEETSRSSKKELRSLKEQLHLLSTDMRRQKSFAMGGIAAAFLLSVGLTLTMMPPSDDMMMSALAPVAQSQNSNQYSEDLIPLEAPDVVALMEEEILAENEAQVAEQIFEDPEPLIPQANGSVVTTAFSREENSGSVTPEASNRSTPKEYVVEEGDNLWKIAKKHPGQGTLMERIEKIKKDNQLSTANIRPGKVLSIYL
jgi:chromosome segregation ATPase